MQQESSDDYNVSKIVIVPCDIGLWKFNIVAITFFCQHRNQPCPTFGAIMIGF